MKRNEREPLSGLVHALLDGTISPGEHARLEGLLREDATARRIYLELADQQARLLHLAEPGLERARDEVDGGAARVAGGRRGRLGRFAIPLAAAAAMVALALALRPAAPPAVRAEGTASGVAMLGETLGAEFETGPMQWGDAIAPGRLRLRRGLAQIDFFSGATALVEGPCEIEIVSAWEARLLAGRVRVHVPPAAKGFVLKAPDVELEDLGTEFALNVEDGSSAVHVFEGEVVARSEGRPPASLTEGMSLSSRKDAASADPGDFLPVADLASSRRMRQAGRLAAWEESSRRQRGDGRLVARYLFQRKADDRWDRLVSNDIEPRVASRAGGAVGARWTEGRWPGKNALEFKRPGDRVRLKLDGAYSALTFSAWVKVDAVDKKYNALLLTDGYEAGEPHWQIHEDGSLMFSIAYPAEGGEGAAAKRNQIYFSPPVFSGATLGRWHHLVVTYENEGGEVVQYFDGREVSRERSPFHRPGRSIGYGPCEIGNWGLPTSAKNFPVRNLNGAIDEFAIYRVALDPDEVATLYENGRPE